MILSVKNRGWIFLLNWLNPLSKHDENYLLKSSLTLYSVLAGSLFEKSFLTLSAS